MDSSLNTLDSITRFEDEFRSGRFPRIQLAQAPIYTFWLDAHWQQNEQYRLKKWFRWNWNRLSDVVWLINQHHNLKLTQGHLIKRFGIPIESGLIKMFESKKTWPDLMILRVENDDELSCTPLRQRDIDEGWNVLGVECFVPNIWTKDVFWALHNGCTRAIREKNGCKSACMNDGTGQFYMSNTSTHNTPRIPTAK